MTTEETTGTELVRFEVTDKSGAPVQAVVPAELAERYPALGNMEEIAELIEEVFGEQGGTLGIGDLVRAKVPSGETKAFTLGEDVTKTIRGIVIVRQERRNYWERSIQDGGGNQAPDCYSRDAITGVGEYGPGSEGNPTGLCADCPLSQWQEGADGKRIPPPCKPQEAVLVLTEGSAFPLLLTIPRTSMTPFRNYWKRTLLTTKMVSLVEVETEIGLNLTKNEAGVEYNELVFKPVRVVTEGMDRPTKKAFKAGLLALSRQFSEILRQVDTSRDTEEPARQNADPDGEGGYSVGNAKAAPVDDDPADAYANAGSAE